MSHRMVTLLSLLCNLSYRMQSHTLCNHDLSTKTVCTCITYFVNVCKNDFYLPIFTHVSDNSCLYALALPKSKEKHCMGKVLDWDNRHFSLYIDSSHFFTYPIYILQRRSSSHTCLMWNVANFMTDEV